MGLLYQGAIKEINNIERLVTMRILSTECAANALDEVLRQTGDGFITEAKALKWRIIDNA